MKLYTKRLILRDLEKKDARDIVENLNNVNVSKNLQIVPYPYTKKHAIEFIKNCRKQIGKKNRSSCEFGIIQKSNNNLAGIIGITKIDKFQGTATIGYWLGENYWRQGIMSEAFERILDFAFKTLKLRIIDIAAWTKNISSNALIKKMGFKYEGMRRKRGRTKATGEIYDVYVYGLLKDELARKKR